jgi:cysteinyl-tRNA synthetase
MSKSLGNFFTVNDILQKYEPMTIRYFLISAHYRHPLDFSEDNMIEAQSAITKIKSAIDTADQLLDKCEKFLIPDKPVLDNIDKLKNNFIESMDNDFNTAQAIGVIFSIISNMNETIKKINQIDNEESKNKEYANLSILLSLIKEILGILGFEEITRKKPLLTQVSSSNSDELVENLMKLLIYLREEARKEKNYSIADKIRAGLSEVGIILEDYPQGTVWKRK